MIKEILSNGSQVHHILLFSLITFTHYKALSVFIIYFFSTVEILNLLFEII